MRILAFLPHYVGYPGHNAGAELTMHEMLVALRMRGHSVLVLLAGPTEANKEGPYVIDGIKVQPYASKHDLHAHSFDADLIISHLHTAERGTLVAKQRGIPSVQYMHNTHQTSHVALSAGPSLVVFNTEWMSQSFGYKGRQAILRPAVRPSTYAVKRGSKVTMVNLWRNKGVHLFWELALRNPETEFLGVLGGYERQEVADLPNVELMDNTPDIRQAYRKAKVILMPSAYESYGRVALEAAASGIPTIASPTLGLQEALGPDGIFVDAPQTAIPGGLPPTWSEEQIVAWNKALKKVLTPSGYGKASKQALARSEEVWASTQTELRTFCESVERLVVT